MGSHAYTVDISQSLILVQDQLYHPGCAQDSVDGDDVLYPKLRFSMAKIRGMVHGLAPEAPQV